MVKNQKLSVGLVFDDSLDSTDGVAQYVKTLGPWLSKHGCRVRYLVGETKMTEWQGDKVYSLAKNQKVNFNGNKLSVPRPADKTRIREILKAEDFDVLHVMMPHSPLMAQRIIDQAAPGTAVVGTFHIFPASSVARFGGKLLSRWYGKKIKRIQAIVSVSPAAQAYAQETFGITSTVVPNPVDVSRFKVSKPANDIDIVFLGRLVKRKGCSQLIDAFYELLKVLPDSRLVIAGDGPQRQQLQKKCRRLGIAENVKFLGYIAESEKPKLLASAKIACFPSLYGESFGIVLIEAMAAGAKVVLGGDNPGYRSVLGQQPLLLIDPADAEAFSRRLALLLKDDKRAKQLRAWQTEILSQYDIDIVGRQIIGLYSGQIARLDKTGNNKTHE
jgi:phosphatidyl-myo-inositol alpha-mannosyltransferase